MENPGKVMENLQKVENHGKKFRSSQKNFTKGLFKNNSFILETLNKLSYLQGFSH